jgi:predicted nucleotidyltransferase
MMALSRDELDKWSERGDPIHAWYSYRIVKESLTEERLNGMSCEIYPQGSYANKTNIAADSDVDMVIALRSAFYAHKGELSLAEITEYEKYYEQADRTWHDFRKVVIRALRPDFFLQEGSKCVKVRSSLIRLPADVLISLDYRYYRSFPSFERQRFVDGVQFYTSNDRKVINYPKRHISACAEKHDRTSSKYRHIVRIAKNARNALIADDASAIKAATSPSYFLESLLWNVPDSCYAGDLAKAYRNVISWLQENTGRLARMNFPNGMGKLFGDTPDKAWSVASARTIIGAMYLQLSP